MPPASSSDPSRDRARAWRRASAVDEDGARRLAEVLVRRHAAEPRAFDDAPDAAGYRHALERDRAALAPWADALGAEALAEVEARQRRFLTERADRLLGRVGDARVLARAVALQLGDVVAGTGPGEEEAADAGDALRVEIGAAAAAAAAPGDVAVELAGLSVELLAAGRAGPAERLLSHYAGEADDFDLYGVIAFHERACALRRAARSVRDAEAATDEARREEALAAARRHVHLALATGRRSLRPPVVVAMGGQVASGKSTLARALADRMAAPRVVADRVRDHLLHGAPGARRPGEAREVHEAAWAEAFAPGFHARVYGELLRRGAVVLATRRAVVLDACFPRARDRAAARALALRRGLPFRFVECRIDPETQRARLAERDAVSPNGGWGEIAARFASGWAPADELTDEERIVVDTARPPEEALAALAAQLPGADGEQGV